MAVWASATETSKVYGSERKVAYVRLVQRWKVLMRLSSKRVGLKTCLA